jgi:hypothetical protein
MSITGACAEFCQDSVSVKMTEADYAKLAKAADHLWPKALLTRSSTVLGLALIGADSVLPKRKEKKHNG